MTFAVGVGELAKDQLRCFLKKALQKNDQTSKIVTLYQKQAVQSKQSKFSTEKTPNKLVYDIETIEPKKK